MSFSLGSGLFSFFPVILFPHKALLVLSPRWPCEGDSLWSSSGRTVPCGRVSCFQPQAAPPRGRAGGGCSQGAKAKCKRRGQSRARCEMSEQSSACGALTCVCLCFRAWRGRACRGPATFSQTAFPAHVGTSMSFPVTSPGQLLALSPG